MPERLQFDRIGYWSEVKLEILKKYAKAYSTILTAHPPLFHVYIDAFAGAGIHIARNTDEFVPGSPMNALNIQPPFREYHLIDISPVRVKSLESLVGPRKNVFIYEGDCNKVLLENVFPRVSYESYRRGLCILDPYGLSLDWRVIHAAGQMKTLDVFFEFSVMGINRGVLWRDPKAVDEVQKRRLTAFWGDDSWPRIAYTGDLFGNPDKQSNKALMEAFRSRLGEVAGFARVPAPIPMRNSTGAIIYYLFFASQKDTAENIVLDIFRKYENRGAI